MCFDTSKTERVNKIFAGVRVSFRFPAKLKDHFAWHFVSITCDGVDFHCLSTASFLRASSRAFHTIRESAQYALETKNRKAGTNSFHGSIDEVSTPVPAEYVRDVHQQTSASRQLHTCWPTNRCPALLIGPTPAPRTKGSVFGPLLVPFPCGTALDTYSNALLCSLQGVFISTFDRLSVAEALSDFGNANFIECPNRPGIAGAGART